MMNNNLSENLKKIRKDNNLSQEQLAEKLGVSRQAISKWESGQAYPEMDKIIQLSKMFDLNIDDLLNNDVREVKKEQASKNSINKYIDDFLKFITNTVELISNMNFKTKIKCLIEQGIIAFILFILVLLLGSVLESVFSPFTRILSHNVYFIIFSILRSLYFLFTIPISLVVMVHIFKIRYLDYYNKFKESLKSEEEDSGENNYDKVDKKPLKENKVIKNESKIVIRDPKHSEYRFISGLLKAVVLFIKFISLIVVFWLCFSLIGFIATLILSFLIVKTGIFFIGILFMLASLIVINIIFLLILINFVFNRKSNKKVFIVSFITSLIICGISFGLIVIGISQFDYVNNSNIDMYENKEIVIQMEDNLYLHDYYSGYNKITYVQEDRNDIKLQYNQNKYYETSYEVENGMIFLHNYCKNPFELVREYLKYVNKKQVFELDNSIRDIKVYASKENIEKLKNNRNSFFEHKRQIEDYEEEIYDLKDKVEDYKNEINQLEDELSYYKNKEE